MRIAKDFMTANPKVYHTSSRISEISKEIALQKITTVPVVDHMKRLVGIVTEISVLRTFLLEREAFSNDAVIANIPQLIQECETVLLTDTLDIVLKQIVKSRSHRVVVVDEGRLVRGIISPKDFLRMFYSIPLTRKVDSAVAALSRKDLKAIFKEKP